jgi:hypothetical protein
MKNLSLGILLLLFSVGAAFAQPYETAAGLRLGGWYGLQVKHFMTSTKAVEAILTPVPRGLHISVLWEQHANPFDVAGLSAYAGIGPHLAFWTDGRYNPWWSDGRYFPGNPRKYYDNNGDPYAGRVAFGVDMILGLEYRIRNFPLSLALDWKPGVLFFARVGGIWDDTALSLRYVF